MRFARGTIERFTASPGHWPLAVVAGSLSSQLFTVLPDPRLIAVLGVCGAGLACWRPTRWAGIALLALGWSLASYAIRLDDRLDSAYARAVVSVPGQVASVPARYPGLVRFRFRPDDEGAGLAVPLPRSIRVSWYHDGPDPPDVAYGQRWRLELRLQPPWGAVNFRGGDPERWLFANGYGALGSVRDATFLGSSRGEPNGLVQRARERVAAVIGQRTGTGAAIVRALAIADRSGLDDATRQRLVDTGTAHLLAISGLHVGLAAAAGFWLLRFLLASLGALRRGRAQLTVAAIGGVACAFAYALLADLGVSTLRAVAMVALVAVALLSARQVHAGAALLRAGAIVLLVDPFAPLGAGFWFSFVAVAALLAVFAPRVTRVPRGLRMLLAQVTVMLTLLPVSAAWFGFASATSLPANLVAIPWVSFLVVPPVLAGIVALPLDAGLASGFWLVAGHAADALSGFLARIEGLGPPPPGLNALDPARLALAVGGAFLLTLPAVFRWKWLAAFLLLPLVLPTRHAPHDEALLEVLDAGQGTALLLHASSRTLVYDSGPGDGGRRSIVRSVILPALGARSPDRIVISHGDLDHAGGLHGLARRFPRTGLRLNAERSSRPRCTAGWSWSWGAARFRALHPSPGLPYLGNDSSCVLSMTGPAGRVLLPGDVSTPIELRLLDRGLGAHDVLVVPHHGSTSSSSRALIERVRPRVAIASAALGNRFDFPRAAIRARYRAAGITLLSTGECGAIRVRLRDGDVVQTRSARRQRARVWRWPAAAHCP